MTEYSNENSGVLFQNDKDGNEKRPDYTGKLDVEGKEYRIAGWKKLGKNNKPFLSLKISEPQESAGQSSGYDKAKQSRDELRADIVHDVLEDQPINLNDIPF